MTCLANFLVYINPFAEEFHTRGGGDLEAKHDTNLLHHPHELDETRIVGKNLNETRQGALLGVFSDTQTLIPLPHYLQNIQKCLAVRIIDRRWRGKMLQITPAWKFIHT
jgi:hypothetical protein